MWAIIKSAYARMRVGEGYQFVWREGARGGEKCLEAVGKRSLGTIDWEWGDSHVGYVVELFPSSSAGRKRGSVYAV